MTKRMMVASANPPSKMYKILFLSKFEPEEGCYVSIVTNFRPFCSRAMLTYVTPTSLLALHP